MNRAIQVSDLPTDISKRNLEDKLMIHFLRAKNGGGEITDILFPSELPTSAVIVFEEVEVAQRVLQVENHVLSISGKHYKLKVESACTEIKVDQVICHISMTIDYGKLLSGKGLMKYLQKKYSDVQFSFDQKAEQCNVAGRFSQIQELSGEIHHLLSLKPNQANSSSYEAEQVQHDQSENRAVGHSDSIRKAARKLSVDSSIKGEEDLRTKNGVQSPENDNVKKDVDFQRGREQHLGNIEDYILLMDSDIYKYIQKFYKDSYENILRQYHVKVLDITSEDITTLILQDTSDCLDSKLSMLQAHQELSKLYQNFEVRLRKEQIYKKDITSDMSLLQTICASLQVQFPKINLNENENYFYLIGMSDDCCLAKKYLQDCKEEFAAKSQKGKHPAPRKDSESGQASISSVPPSLRGYNGNDVFVQVGGPKADARKDHKLAPTFGGLRENINPSKTGSRSVEDDLTLVPEQTCSIDNLLTSHSIEVSKQDNKHRSISEIQQKLRRRSSDSQLFTSADKTLTSATGEFVLPNKTGEDSLTKMVKDFSVLSVQSKNLKSPDKAADNILFRGHESSSALSTNKGDKFFQYSKSNKTHGPIKPYHFETSTGPLFHQGDLQGNMQTLQSLTTKGSDGHSFKPLLRRTSSTSELLKPKPSRDLSNNFQGMTKSKAVEQEHITEEFPVESSVWSYLKDIYDSLIRNVSSKTEVVVNEQTQGDITIVKLSAVSKANTTAAKQDILSFYTLVMKNLVQQFLSYADLGIEHSSQKTVDQWYSNLKKNFPKVKFIKEQTGFRIIATYEHCLKVTETFKPKFKDTFSATDVSFAASNPYSYIGTEPFKDTEGKVPSKFTEYSSLLGQSPHGSKTPVPDMDETSLRKGEKLEEQPSSLDTDQEIIESLGHRKVVGKPKKNCNSQPGVEEESLKKHSVENNGTRSNSGQEHNPFTDQKKSPKPFEEYSSFSVLHDQGDSKSQKVMKHIGEGEGIKAKKALPDKFQFTANKLVKEGHWHNRGDGLHSSKVESGTQSLPVISYTSTSVLLQNRDGSNASETATDSGDRLQDASTQQHDNSSVTTSQEWKLLRNSQQSQIRSPAIGLEAQELIKSATSCSACKQGGCLVKLDCGHDLCKECSRISESSCPECHQTTHSIKNENQCLGSLESALLHISLPGFIRDLTLKITYYIPDGIQRECDPNPGQPFKGGIFQAFLPDNANGRKILRLLREAFTRGLTFKIVSGPSGLARVTWNDIPHKTKTSGGISQQAYPDSSYLKNVLAALENHGIQ
ncbi:uncharacterized protein si:busm1-163l24.3 isoform X1 [Stegostoma tigrinum]|uniref:uncharacterized protein si:busm1-163l24.3 isoform X1 n=2 Tax=Stegostoma tigrinum TaxID=3053191 RepID=UPI00202B678C|nr:uncharacterized protein si:busm1-163l24.3 isoform X1 [Stegostoma tigrinum]